MAQIQFQTPINVSVQVGDTLYASVVVNGQSGSNHPSPGGANTKPVAIGKITSINPPTNQITYDTTGYANAPGSFVYIFASKDNRANTSGIVGYFAECEFRNHSSKAAEIFVTGVDYVPSSK
tara:strand:+ start:163 stop:528 length:366 start_codon:yes stop_codon:yes gene_type:complete